MVQKVLLLTTRWETCDCEVTQQHGGGLPEQVGGREVP